MKLLLCDLVLSVAVFMWLFIPGLKKERETAHEIMNFIAFADPGVGRGLDLSWKITSGYRFPTNTSTDPLY